MKNMYKWRGLIKMTKITASITKSDNVYTIQNNYFMLKFYFLDGAARLTIHTPKKHPYDLDITELKNFFK